MRDRLKIELCVAGVGICFFIGMILLSCVGV